MWQKVNSVSLTGEDSPAESGYLLYCSRTSVQTPGNTIKQADGVKNERQASINSFLTCSSSSCQGMVHALAAIYREHGILGLWRGSSAAIPRVSVGSAAQLCTFSSSKELVIDLQVRMCYCSQLGLLRFDCLNSGE